MELAPPSPAPSSPDLEGYNSALEEVNKTVGGSEPDSDDSSVTITPPKGLSIIGVNLGPARSRSGTGELPPRDRRGRFTRKRGSSKSANSDSADPELASDSEVLTGSLEWDPLESPLLNDTVISDNWSTTSTYDETLLQPRPLSTLPEESGSRAASSMAADNKAMNNSNASGDSDKVAATIADIEEIVMEVEEDVMPNMGKELDRERLDTMMAKVEQLRKTCGRATSFSPSLVEMTTHLPCVTVWQSARKGLLT
jgi:hypothetical protein